MSIYETMELFLILVFFIGGIGVLTWVVVEGDKRCDSD